MKEVFKISYYFHLYTPNMKEQASGKFVACEKLLFANNTPFVINTIGYYERYIGIKHLDIYNSVYILNEEQCEVADVYTKTTFFTDFLKRYDCNGMFIRIT